MSHSLHCALGFQGFGGVSDPGRVQNAAATSALWEKQRSRVELAVLRRLGSLALLLLRRVAGEGRSVTSQVGSGSVNAKAIKLLGEALDLAAELLPTEA